MALVRNNESGGFRFDRRVSLEAILAFVTLIIAGFTAWYKLTARVDFNAQEVLYLKDADAVQKAELKELRVEIKESLKEIHRKLDRGR